VPPLSRYQNAHHLAAKAGGFLTSAELHGLQVPPSTVTRWCELGLLVRVCRGTYRTNATSYGFDEALLMAQKAMSSQQAIGSRSALSLWELPGGLRSIVTLTGPKGIRTLAPGIHNREYRDLRPSDITLLAGMRVTTAQRTILDCSAFCSEALIGLQLTAAVAAKHFTYPEMSLRALELTRPGKRGVGKVRKVLESRTTEARPLNGYERKAKALFRKAGFRSPESQFRIVAGRRIFFADFVWPDCHLLVECDSMLAHSTPEQLDNDLARQNALMSAGWHVRRFSYWDVVDRPDYVIATIAPFFR
jgi:very-short-patch-repair endonuclease